MKETTVKTVIKSDNEKDEINETGYLIGEELKWHSSQTKTSYFLNFKERKLIKIDKDKEIELNFQKENILVTTKEGMTNIKIEVKKYNLLENKIELIYLIDKNSYELTIEW